MWRDWKHMKERELLAGKGDAVQDGLRERWREREGRGGEGEREREGEGEREGG